MEYYLDAFSNFVNFKGRARRKAYWMFVLFNMVASIVLSGVDALLGLGFLAGLYGLVMILPSLAYAARRLHDTNRAGWWLLLWLIPVIGWIVLIVFLVLDSTEDNEYGPNPKAGEA